MRIMTCNIRYYGAKDGENHWAQRRNACAHVIAAHSPDIICFQEMWRIQRKHLSTDLKGFRMSGGYDRGHRGQPLNTIFYKEILFSKIDSGMYWLSEIPDMPGTKFRESMGIRFTNWILLEDRFGKTLRVINTHLDHPQDPRGQKAREKQSQIIMRESNEFSKKYPHIPQILTGDMNCGSRNSVISNFKKNDWQDSYETIHGPEEPGFTFHGFGNPSPDYPDKIDWILIKGNIKVCDAKIIKDTLDGKFPSDHYFVLSEIEL